MKGFAANLEEETTRTQISAGYCIPKIQPARSDVFTKEDIGRAMMTLLVLPLRGKGLSKVIASERVKDGSGVIKHQGRT
jgi:hypothetical protein